VTGRLRSAARTGVAASVSAASRYVAWALARWPSAGEERARRHFAQSGIHFLRRHYYLPIPDEEDLDPGFFDRLTEMPGVEMNESASLHLLETVFPRYVDEFRARVPLHADGPGFHLLNGTYMAVDAHVYWSLIRHGKPRRIVEIGGGNSSLLAGMACERNREEGRPAELVVVEPYPGEAIARGFPGLTRLVRAKVQDADPALFASLGEGDILFLDSSHVLRAGGDVQLEYLEILPRLARGVLVHIHDISLPKPYPRVYFETGMYWNEQYLLQAFLAFNSRFEILWPGNWMMIRHPEKVCGVFPEFHEMRKLYPQSEPTGFWMRVCP
jgi:hypothetical protein